MSHVFSLVDDDGYGDDEDDDDDDDDNDDDDDDDDCSNRKCVTNLFSPPCEVLLYMAYRKICR